jgi:hypothetical protein
MKNVAWNPLTFRAREIYESVDLGGKTLVNQRIRLRQFGIDEAKVFVAFGERFASQRVAFLGPVLTMRSSSTSRAGTPSAWYFTDLSRHGFRDIRCPSFINLCVCPGCSFQFGE